MTWHPPIPRDVLYSPQAIALGPALALLGYCYDCVERDGTITIRLDRAADTIGKPYRTIKDWWAQVKGSGIFHELKDRGKKGWTARFDSDWLDWRIMQNNYGDVQVPVRGEILPVNDGEGHFKDISSPCQGRDPALTPPAYKVLHDDHDSMLPVSQNAQPAQRKRERKKKPIEATQTALPDPVRDALCEVCALDLKICTNTQRLQLNQTLKIIRRSAANQQQSDQEVVSTIKYVADWYRKHDWRGQKSQPLTPALIRECWGAAVAQRSKTQARASPPPKRYTEDTLSPTEIAERTRALLNGDLRNDPA